MRWSGLPVCHTLLVLLFDFGFDFERKGRCIIAPSLSLPRGMTEYGGPTDLCMGHSVLRTMAGFLTGGGGCGERDR